MLQSTRSPKRPALLWLILGIVAVLSLTFLFVSKQSDASWPNKVVDLSKTNALPGKLSIQYPLSGALFPPGIASPIIRFSDTTESKLWVMHISLKSTGRTIFCASTQTKTFQPNSEAWRQIQKRSIDSVVTLTILGVQSNLSHRLVSGASIEFSTSRDSVGAPIFFRQVPLPFDLANNHPGLIRYCLGRVDSGQPPRVLLEKLPVCGNCHSFSRDGKTMGMDVDYANDKGSYAIVDLKPITVLSPDKIITWSDYKRPDGQLTFGLLSQVSPDGRFVMSTVKDRSIFVSLPEKFEYSQLFFPIRGILAFYDRATKSFHRLPGADDARFVQSNPNWTPDGKQVLFARSIAYTSPAIEANKAIIVPAEVASDFISGKKQFKYDIYRLGFNGGAGGKAEPVPGASKNGKSNFFPRVSPNGKWLVFTQANNFMLLQPDSKLMIIPASGGTARPMHCNRGNMNSWHSFSPNGSWMVFSSKERGPYTQLWLTHISENGEDSPPILLEHLMSPDRAANIPEFLNQSPNMLQQVIDGFSSGANYHYRIAKNLVRAGDLQAAAKELDIAALQAPNDVETLLDRGTLNQRLGNKEGCLADFNAVVKLAPKDVRGFHNLGVAQMSYGRVREALDNFTKALAINPKFVDSWQQRAYAKLTLDDAQGAFSDARKAIDCDPKQKRFYVFAAKILQETDDLKGAVRYLDLALQLDPDYGQALLNRSYSRLLLGDASTAEADLHRGRITEGSDPLVPLIEAMLAFKKGDTDNGCKILMQARQNGELGNYESAASELISSYCKK